MGRVLYSFDRRINYTMNVLFHNEKKKVRHPRLEKAVADKALDDKKIVYLIHKRGKKIPVTKLRWDQQHWRHRSISYDCGE
jgi:hypothetical protein